MRLPFKIDSDPPALQIRFEFTGEMTGSGTIAVVTEGGGEFIEIRSDDPIRMTHDEIAYLASWADEACRELDEFNREGHAAHEPIP